MTHVLGYAMEPSEFAPEGPMMGRMGNWFRQGRNIIVPLDDGTETDAWPLEFNPDGILMRETGAQGGGPARTGGATRNRMVMPPLVIRVRPFAVLDLFDFNQPGIPPTRLAMIQRIAHLIVASWNSGEPIQTVRLVGHTDNQGPTAYNKTLGQRRAEAVQARLLTEVSSLRGGLPSGARVLPVTVVPQSQGETKPATSNTTTQGRARNRRVQVFIPTTCQSFFAQYDLRFLPGDPLFGIPANPNMTDSKRVSDVSSLVPVLLQRRNARAAASLVRRQPSLSPPTAVRSAAQRLSTAQLALYREFFPDGSGGIDFDRFQVCFEGFTNGDLRGAHPITLAQGVGEPNGGFFFLFAEFAFLCIDLAIDRNLWARAQKTLVKTQEIFMHVYRPAPASPAAFPTAPGVGAPPPACPGAAGGAPMARRRLDDFSNSNFDSTGQSNASRKEALRRKYAPMDLAALRNAAMENMLRVQCMP